MCPSAACTGLGAQLHGFTRLVQEIAPACNTLGSGLLSRRQLWHECVCWLKWSRAETSRTHSSRAQSGRADERGVTVGALLSVSLQRRNESTTQNTLTTTPPPPVPSPKNDASRTTTRLQQQREEPNQPLLQHIQTLARLQRCTRFAPGPERRLVAVQRHQCALSRRGGRHGPRGDLLFFGSVTSRRWSSAPNEPQYGVWTGVDTNFNSTWSVRGSARQRAI